MWCSDDPDPNSLFSAVEEATCHLYQKVIPDFAFWLEENQVDSETLITGVFFGHLP
jgi:hypothetical protein